MSAEKQFINDTVVFRVFFRIFSEKNLKENSESSLRYSDIMQT